MKPLRKISKIIVTPFMQLLQVSCNLTSCKRDPLGHRERNHHDNVSTRDRSRPQDLLSRGRLKGFSNHRSAARLPKFVAYVPRPDPAASGQISRDCSGLRWLWL